MINISVKKNDCQKISMIKIKGHAGYDESGKDIVCAAVSSTVITTVNNILSLDKTIEYIEDKDCLTIVVIKDNDVTQKLLNNMLSMLSELEIDYPDYIKYFKEV